MWLKRETYEEAQYFLTLAPVSKEWLGAPATLDHHYPWVHPQEEKVSCATNMEAMTLCWWQTIFSQITLHLVRNQPHFLGNQPSSAISKVKRATVVGTSKFDDRWCSKAEVALQGQVKSVALMSSPLSFVLVCGMRKFMYLRPLVAMLCLMSVKWEKKCVKQGQTTNQSEALPV